MVTVIMTTWDDGTGLRYEYAVACHESLRIGITPNPHIIVTDDGSHNFNNLAMTLKGSRTSLLTGPHNGIGSSLNRAINHLSVLDPHEPWMYTTDDWLLTDNLDLTRAIQLLDIGYDMVRVGPPHPNLECTIQFQAGIGWWLDIHTYLPATGFAFATRPFIAAPSLYRKIGAFKEGVDSYECERDYSDRVWDHGGIKIAAVTLHGPWEHIGEYAVGNRPVTV